MLYLIRHADALPGDPDEARPLSPEGREQVRSLGAFFRRCRGEDLVPAEIWHSPLARAGETATSLALGAGWNSRRREVEGLQPDDNPAVIAERLESFDRPLALVGHNPHLTLLATLLVTGRSAPPAFLVRKCALIGLEPARGRGRGSWVVDCHIVPQWMI
jgi:phosphohistidine phosphatase